MKKILVSDYDETFYLNDEDIKNNISLLNNYSDKILFIIATGRSYFDYLKKKEKYNIKSDYVILNHGATIMEGNYVLYNEPICENIKNELIKLLQKFKICKFFCCAGLDSRVSYTTNNLTKIHVNYGNECIAKNMYELLTNKYSDYINCFFVSKNTALEIVSKNADKKNAILKIIEEKKLNKCEIYTVGNGDTDYEMLKYFNGYKMQKCSQKISQLDIKSVSKVSDLIREMFN